MGAHRGAAAAARKSRWKATEQKLFRSVFTQKDPEAEPVAKGGRDEGYEPDADLRDFENVPLKDDIDAYFEREVRPHVPDAWMDRSKDKVGYEINFNRHFYTLHAAAAAGRDRRGAEAGGGGDHAAAAGGDDMSDSEFMERGGKVRVADGDAALGPRGSSSAEDAAPSEATASSSLRSAGALHKTPWPHAPLHQLAQSGTYFVTVGTYHKEQHFRGADR